MGILPTKKQTEEYSKLRKKGFSIKLTDKLLKMGKKKKIKF